LAALADLAPCRWHKGRRTPPFGWKAQDNIVVYI
jgi:hypothetical protein